MMNDDQLKSWLLENGGPAIHLQVSAHLSPAAIGATNGDSSPTPENLVAELLTMPEVQQLLSYLDAFKNETREPKTLEHLIHYYQETCIDNFFPQLMDLGFRAGISIFDEKMEPVRDLYSHLLNEHYGYTLMMSRFFLMAGYAHPEVIGAVKHRLVRIYPVAAAKIFDIYQDATKLPKVPKHWIGKGIIKDELNPFADMKPLPVIYDIAALAYFPREQMTPETQQQINAVITYILDPQFQILPEGYGLLWVKSRRIYHSCGWNPTLPYYEDTCGSARYPRPGNYNLYNFLYYLEIMSHFSVAHPSKWFQDSLNRLEQFKTSQGTYLFPKEYFPRKFIPTAVLNSANLKLKRPTRETLMYELMSTLFMLKIQNKLIGESSRAGGLA